MHTEVDGKALKIDDFARSTASSRIDVSVVGDSDEAIDGIVRVLGTKTDVSFSLP